MSSVNVGSVVMEALLDTRQFQKSLSSLGDMAKTGFDTSVPFESVTPKLPSVMPQELPNMADIFGSATSQALKLAEATGLLDTSLWCVADTSNVVSAMTKLTGQAYEKMFGALIGGTPHIGNLAAAQANASAVGIQSADKLTSHWAAFKNTATAACSEVSSGAVGAAAQSGAILGAMLANTSSRSFSWFSMYEQSVLTGSARLADGVQAIWADSLPFWKSFGKSIANAVIWTMNALNTSIVSSVFGLLNRIGEALGGLGALFGQSWGWSVPPAPAKIPFLARGGIISQPTLAMVGERGAEAVVPLENNTGWINALAAQLAGTLGGTQGSAPASVNLFIDGRKLAEATIADYQSVASRRGISLQPSRA